METRSPGKIFRRGLLFFTGNETLGSSSEQHAEMFIAQARAYFRVQQQGLGAAARVLAPSKCARAAGWIGICSIRLAP